MMGNAPKLRPLRFRREELMSAAQAARVHELAKGILRDIGLEVRHAGVLARLHAAGFHTRDRRVFFEPSVVEEHVEDMRRLIAAHQPAADPTPDDGRLTLSVSSYSLHVHDLGSGHVVPYTTERLIEMCKLVDTLADAGVEGAPPGIPVDEPPDLQPVAQYRIAALYARQGATPVDPTSAKTVNYQLDMAEVMGEPIRGLPVYLPTPLCLGGESLEAVLACLDRLSHIRVSSMPATGATAPVHPFGALAVAAAEQMGGLVAMRVVTNKAVTFGVGIFPFDLRSGAMVFGSPENTLFEMLCGDMNRFYGWPEQQAPANIHVMAKLPDAQSAAEKAAIMATGAFLGARHFSCAGTLSLDEIFSPEQLLLDCEIRDWLQRAIQGVWLGEEAVSDWLAEVQDGVQRGFMGLDSTLDHHNHHMWYPRHFERAAVGSWLSRGEPHLSSRLQAEVRKRIASHDYELDGERRRAVERIYQMARQAVTA